MDRLLPIFGVTFAFAILAFATAQPPPFPTGGDGIFKGQFGNQPGVSHENPFVSRAFGSQSQDGVQSGQGIDINVEVDQSSEEGSRRRKRQNEIGQFIDKFKRFFGEKDSNNRSEKMERERDDAEEIRQQPPRSKRNFINPLMMGTGASQYGSMFASPYQQLNSNYPNNQQNDFGSNQQNELGFPNYNQPNYNFQMGGYQHQHGLFPSFDQSNYYQHQQQQQQPQYSANSADQLGLSQQQQQNQQRMIMAMMAQQQQPQQTFQQMPMMGPQAPQQLPQNGQQQQQQQQEQQQPYGGMF